MKKFVMALTISMLCTVSLMGQQTQFQWNNASTAETPAARSQVTASDYYVVLGSKSEEPTDNQLGSYFNRGNAPVGVIPHNDMYYVVRGYNSRAAADEAVATLTQAGYSAWVNPTLAGLPVKWWYPALDGSERATTNYDYSLGRIDVEGSDAPPTPPARSGGVFTTTIKVEQPTAYGTGGSPGGAYYITEQIVPAGETPYRQEIVPAGGYMIQVANHREKPSIGAAIPDGCFKFILPGDLPGDSSVWWIFWDQLYPTKSAATADLVRVKRLTGCTGAFIIESPIHR